MQNSKEYLKNHNIMPFISFKEQRKHTVKLLSDEAGNLTDASGKVVEGMHYLVEEGGQKKKFFTSSVGLIQRLAECDVSETVIIEMKSKKGANGFVSFFEVIRPSQGESDQVPSVDYGE